MQPCCDTFSDLAKEGKFVFSTDGFRWTVEIAHGFIVLSFCPFCGAYLNWRPRGQNGEPTIVRF